MVYSIAQLNRMSQDDFTQALGAIYEDTPSIARQAWEQRPFTDIADVQAKMTAVVRQMSPAEQLKLIQAHPALATKTKMAEASVQEQAGAGLDQLSPSEYDRFHQLNQDYQTKFGFPFIIAVKNHTKDSILNAFEQRLEHSVEDEIQEALAQIKMIAEFRLTAAIELH